MVYTVTPNGNPPTALAVDNTKIDVLNLSNDDVASQKKSSHRIAGSFDELNT